MSSKGSSRVIVWIDGIHCNCINIQDLQAKRFSGDRAYGIPSFVPFKISFVTIATGGLEMNMTQATFSGIETGSVVDYR